MVRAGLGSRTVLALVDNLGRVGLAVDSLGRLARSGDFERSERRLAIPSLPLYKPALARGRMVVEDGPAASETGLVDRTVGRGNVEADAATGLEAAIVRDGAPLCRGAAVGRRRYLARL